MHARRALAMRFYRCATNISTAHVPLLLRVTLWKEFTALRLPRSCLVASSQSMAQLLPVGHNAEESETTVYEFRCPRSVIGNGPSHLCNKAILLDFATVEDKEKASQKVISNKSTRWTVCHDEDGVANKTLPDKSEKESNTSQQPQGAFLQVSQRFTSHEKNFKVLWKLFS